MPKYLLQLEDRGAFVGEHETLLDAQHEALEQGYAVTWNDRPSGEPQSFAEVFADAADVRPYPVAVAYPSDDRTLWIWYDPTA
jgi:hypothetical protein